MTIQSWAIQSPSGIEERWGWLALTNSALELVGLDPNFFFLIASWYFFFYSPFFKATKLA